MLLPAFDPPGFLDDLNADQKKRWSESISDDVDSEMAGKDAVGHHFYNATKTDPGNDVTTAEISWTAFPRKVQINSPSDKVLSLYQQFVSPNVTKADLFPDGTNYDPNNKFNNSTTNGAMHLGQVNNTLGAEIDIAVRSTIIRKINGTVLTGERELIDCGQYGDPDRNSDPHIGAQVNMIARKDAFVAVANPVALYIAGFAPLGWQTPDSSDPKDFWKIVRGDAAHGLRAVYEVPAAKGFTVGDITINGLPIAFGAQIVDFITIKLVGQAAGIGKNVVPPVTSCLGDGGAPVAAAAAEAGPSRRGG